MDNAKLLEDWISKAVEKDASDMHIPPGGKPVMRIREKLHEIDTQEIIDAYDMKPVLEKVCPRDLWTEYETLGYTTFAFTMPNLARVRATFYKDLEGVSVHFRFHPLEVPNIEDLGLPENLLDKLWMARRGLILITAPPGHGATTTMAAVLDMFNRLRNARIMSIEDPVEIVHSNKNSLVSQRNARDLGGSMSVALSRCLVEQPDIVCVGEVGDSETVKKVVDMIRAGMLVVAVMPFRTVADAIRFFIRSFPFEMRQDVLNLLSENLLAGLAQVLVKLNGSYSRSAAREVLFKDPIVQMVLQKGDFDELSMIMRNSKSGMAEMNMQLMRMVQANDITADIAYHACADQNRLAADFKRAGIEIPNLTQQERACLEYATAPQRTIARAKPGAQDNNSAVHSRSQKRRGWF